MTAAGEGEFEPSREALCGYSTPEAAVDAEGTLTVQGCHRLGRPLQHERGMRTLVG